MKQQFEPDFGSRKNITKYKIYVSYKLIQIEIPILKSGS